MRRSAAALAVAIATLAVAASPATASSFADRTPRSLSPDARILGITPSTPLYWYEYQKMGAGGVRNLRLPIFWEDLQPQPGGGYDWSKTDTAAIFAAAAGIRLQPFVMGVPPWMASRDDRFWPPIHSFEFVREWKQLLRALVDRYGPRGELWQALRSVAPSIPPQPIRTWQIWNEPNSWSYWHPRPTAAKDYGDLLKLSATALHSRDPRATVVAAGLFENPSDGSRMTTFLNGLYSVPGVERSFDAIAIHPYSSNVSGVVRQIREARGVMRQNGDRQTPLWITELGWPTQSGTSSGTLTKTEPEQARILTQAFRLILRNQNRWNIGRLTWYTWRDSDLNPGCAQCSYSGLFRSDLTPKPAWKAFVRLTGGTP